MNICITDFDAPKSVGLFPFKLWQCWTELVSCVLVACSISCLCFYILPQTFYVRWWPYIKCFWRKIHQKGFSFSCELNHLRKVLQFSRNWEAVRNLYFGPRIWSKQNSFYGLNAKNRSSKNFMLHVPIRVWLLRITES